MDRRLQRRQFDGRQTVRIRTVNGARIKYQCFADDVLFGDMGVSVADEIPFSRVNSGLKQGRVVRMQKGDFLAFAFDVAE